MNTETPAIETQEVHPAVLTSTSGPIQQPIKFILALADIAHMKAEAAQLIITGPDDKTGYETLSRFRIDVLKAQRLDLEERIEELTRPHLNYTKQVKAVGGELVESLKEIENDCSLKEKAYKDERERIAREKMLFQQQRTEGRVNTLRAYGFEWNARDESYDFIRGELSLHLRINFDNIKEFSDQEYEENIQMRADAIHKSEVAAIAQQVEAKRMDDERIAKEQQDERDRLMAQKKEQDDRAAELKQQQDQIETDRKALQDEKDRQWVDNAVANLLVYGFTSEGEGVYSLAGCTVNTDQLLGMDEDDIAELIGDATDAVARIERDRLENEAIQKVNREQAIIDERERRKADKERVARLKPDKKEINLFFARMLNTKPWPLMDELETIDFMADAYDRIRDTIGLLKSELDAL